MLSAEEEFKTEVEKIFQPGFVYKGWPDPCIHFLCCKTDCWLEKIGESIWIVLQKPVVEGDVYVLSLLTPHGNRNLCMSSSVAYLWLPDLKTVKRIWPK